MVTADQGAPHGRNPGKDVPPAQDENITASELNERTPLVITMVILNVIMFLSGWQLEELRESCQSPRTRRKP